MSTALGSAVLTAAGLIAAPQAGASVPLTHAASSAPAQLSPVGRSTSYVVVNDESNDVVYLANPGGRGAAQVLERDAQAEAVAGNLVVDRSVTGARHWRLLGTSRTGTVPSSWEFVAPDGGMRVRTAGVVAVLDYLHLSGATETFALPVGFPAAGATYSVVAGPTGVVVTATTSSAVRAVYSNLQAPVRFTSLSTAGLAPGRPLTCTSLAATGVGCTAPDQSIRLYIGSATAPQVSTLSSTPLDIAVTDGYTSWTEPHAGSRPACPCDLISLSPDGGALSASAGLTAGGLAAGSGRIFYATGHTLGSAGVYLTDYAGGSAVQVQAAPRRPLQATVPALGPDRAAWVDDSSADGPVRTALITAAGQVGRTYGLTHGASLVPVAVSGLRTVFQTRSGRLQRVYDSGTNSVIATGTLVSLSGTRVVYRATNRHLMLLDLVARSTTDLTRTLGATSAALWGDYLSYGQADGSIWRTHRVGAEWIGERLSGPVRGTTATRVAAWGDWTAWIVRTGPTTVTAFRNARTMGVIRSITDGSSLAGASAAGVLTRTSSGFELRNWATATRIATLPPNTGTAGPVGGVPAIDGRDVASLVNGRPTLSTLPVTVTDRPRSLGNPWAPRAARRSGGWRFELPTSAPLSACSVEITRGRYHATLPCDRAAAGVGEVVTFWRPGLGNGHLPPLRYRWTVHARGADGTLLAADGSSAPTTGTFVLS